MRRTVRGHHGRRRRYVLKQIRAPIWSTSSAGGGRQSMAEPAVTARVMERIRSGAGRAAEFRSLTDQERPSCSRRARYDQYEIAQEMFLATRP